MHYLDRSGERIDSLKWAKLYRDRAYSIVRSTRQGFHEVTTSWIGVEAELERKPGLFLVQLRRVRRVKAGNEVIDQFCPVSDEWYASEKEALARHSELAVQPSSTY
jgi:predicted small secreted protein